MIEFRKIRLLLIGFVMVLLGLECSAENNRLSKNIYVDFFSSSNIVSVNYDMRFPGNAVLGWRVGVGYSRSMFDKAGSFLGDYRYGISLPLGVNALFGQQKISLK